MTREPTRAAQYIRMSTDAQDLSPEIQMSAIAAYAARGGLTIVKTYLDAGRSGLTLHKRPAMKALLEDVTEHACAFGAILVYDISRWGRFQDTDASAYYEYHCRLHGVEVRYVQEPFAECTAPLVSLLKGMKRVMAAEYSRELGVKTRAGQGVALERGFHIGSLPAIGIGRIAVSKQGGGQRPLAANEHKSGRSEHLRWVPGPQEEVHLVQRIFRLYTTGDMTVSEIVRLLRAEGQTARTGKPITAGMLYRMLPCEAYMGNFVWGRCDASKRPRDEGHERFTRIESAIAPIITRETWRAAKERRAKRAGVVRSKEELLSDLREAVRRNPGLTASDLVASDCACRATYVNMFGSFAAALAHLGLVPHQRASDDYRPCNQKRALGSRLCSDIACVVKRMGIACTRPRAANGCHSLEVNGNVRVRIQLLWRRQRHGAAMWFLPKIYREHFDHVLLVRMNEDDSVFDSVLLTAVEYFDHRRWFPDALANAPRWLTTEGQIAAKLRALTSARSRGLPPAEARNSPCDSGAELDRNASEILESRLPRAQVV